MSVGSGRGVWLAVNDDGGAAMRLFGGITVDDVLQPDVLSVPLVLVSLGLAGVGLGDDGWRVHGLEDALDFAAVGVHSHGFLEPLVWRQLVVGFLTGDGFLTTFLLGLHVRLLHSDPKASPDVGLFYRKSTTATDKLVDPKKIFSADCSAQTQEILL